MRECGVLEEEQAGERHGENQAIPRPETSIGNHASAASAVPDAPTDSSGKDGLVSDARNETMDANTPPSHVTMSSSSASDAFQQKNSLGGHAHKSCIRPSSRATTCVGMNINGKPSTAGSNARRPDTVDPAAFANAKRQRKRRPWLHFHTPSKRPPFDWSAILTLDEAARADLRLLRHEN